MISTGDASRKPCHSPRRLAPRAAARARHFIACLFRSSFFLLFSFFLSRRSAREGFSRVPEIKQNRRFARLTTVLEKSDAYKD